MNADPDRFACYRGFSPIRRPNNDIRDSADIKAFEELVAKIASDLAAVVEQGGAPGTPAPSPWPAGRGAPRSRPGLSESTQSGPGDRWGCSWSLSVG